MKKGNASKTKKKEAMAIEVKMNDHSVKAITEACNNFTEISELLKLNVKLFGKVLKHGF